MRGFKPSTALLMMTNLLTATVVVITELTTVRGANWSMRVTFCPQVGIVDFWRTFFLAVY